MGGIVRDRYRDEKGRITEVPGRVWLLSTRLRAELAAPKWIDRPRLSGYLFPVLKNPILFSGFLWPKIDGNVGLLKDGFLNDFCG